MKRVGSRIIALAFVALSLTFAGHATAQSGDKAEARELFFKARDALNAGDFVSAADLYKKAYDLYPAPTSALGLARSLVQLGRLVEASEVYTQLAKTTLAEDAVDAFKEAIAEGKTEGEALDKRIPRLTVFVEGPAPTAVDVDGKAVTLTGAQTTLRLDPGKRVVTARHDGYEPFKQDVALAESAVAEVRIVLVPIKQEGDPVDGPGTPASEGGLDGMQIAGIAIGGLGVVGLVVWGVTGIMYLGDASTVEDDCVDNRCNTPAGLDAADRAKTLGVVNTITLFAGIGLVAVGTTLFLLGGSSEEEPSVALTFGPVTTLSGRF